MNKMSKYREGLMGMASCCLTAALLHYLALPIGVNVVVSAVAMGCCYALYWLFCLPYNRVRSLEEVGWRHKRHEKLWKQNIDFSRKHRKPGKYPQPFPNGWFVILGKKIKDGKRN